MFPNLSEATKDYWRKLDELENAYQQGKIPLEAVDAKVAKLMAELAAERRATLNFFFQSLQHWLNSQREVVLGLAVLVIAVYAWAAGIFLS